MAPRREPPPEDGDDRAAARVRASRARERRRGLAVQNLRVLPEPTRFPRGGARKLAGRLAFVGDSRPPPRWEENPAADPRTPPTRLGAAAHPGSQNCTEQRRLAPVLVPDRGRGGASRSVRHHRRGRLDGARARHAPVPERHRDVSPRASGAARRTRAGVIGEPPPAPPWLTAQRRARERPPLPLHVALRAVRFHRTASFAAATSRADAPQPSSREVREQTRLVAVQKFPARSQTSHGGAPGPEPNPIDRERRAPGRRRRRAHRHLALERHREWNAPSTYSRTTTSFVLVVDADPPLPPPESSRRPQRRRTRGASTRAPARCSSTASPRRAPHARAQRPTPPRCYSGRRRRRASRSSPRRNLRASPRQPSPSRGRARAPRSRRRGRRTASARPANRRAAPTPRRSTAGPAARTAPSRSGTRAPRSPSPRPTLDAIDAAGHGSPRRRAREPRRARSTCPAGSGERTPCAGRRTPRRARTR